MIDIEQLIRENPRNFIPNYLETSLRLSQVISKISENESLNKQMILKGGSAVQCYLGNIKRLYLDCDFDFVFNSINNQSQERVFLKQNLSKIMKNLNYELSNTKSRCSYSLDSLRFPYKKMSGNTDYIKLEINYSHGEHIYPSTTKKWLDHDFLLDNEISILKLEELFGMKIKALLERGSAKDLWDIKNLIEKYESINLEQIKKSYLFYFTLATKKFNPLSLEELENMPRRAIVGGLYPYLPKASKIDLDLMKKEVLSFLNEVLIFTTEEKEFFDYFTKGEYHPELLFQDNDIVERVNNNPIAKYKVKLKKNII